MADKEQQKENGFGRNGNLIPRTREELSEMGKKGGPRAAAARKQKRQFRDLGIAILKKGLKTGKVNTIEELQSFNSKEIKDLNLDTKTLTFIAQVTKALKGDTRAFEVIRDTIGEKPIDQIEMDKNAKVNIINDLPLPKTTKKTDKTKK